MSKCASCLSLISRQKPSVSCHGRCKKSFHVSCAKIPTEFLKLLDIPGHSWRCQDCKDIPDSYDSDNTPSSLDQDSLSIMKSIKSDLTSLNSKYDALMEAITFCSGKMSDFENTLSKMEERVSGIEKLTKENALLKNDIKSISDRVNQLEQYTRINNIEIQGVNEKSGENVYTILETIGDTIGCQVTRNDVDIAHRVSRLSSEDKRPKPIIARFISRLKRDAFLAAAKNYRRSLNKQEPGIAIENVSKSLYVNEHLTTKNKILLGKAKTTARDKQFKYVWTRNGHVYMRRNDTSGVFKVNCEADLGKLK